MAEYELIDFGDGRKLEALGGYWIDRPAPAATTATAQHPELWRRAAARFEGRLGNPGGEWTFHRPWPASLRIDGPGFRLPVQPSPQGHIGVFPEQRPQWEWLARSVGKAAEPPCEALNLFAYTGGSTLALASAGAHVAHVDAARPNVAHAFRAAELSRLGDRPIRFLVDDAVKFVRRERRRGRTYDIICMDPPAYGHGPRGSAWQLVRDLWPLLGDSLELLKPDGRILVTGHSRHPGFEEVRDWLARRGNWQSLEAGRSELHDRGGRILNSGHFVRGRRPS
jgi:23S rRNA (cytosine1962-C5)-methyltransferase